MKKNKINDSFKKSILSISLISLPVIAYSSTFENLTSERAELFLKKQNEKNVATLPQMILDSLIKSVQDPDMSSDINYNEVWNTYLLDTGIRGIAAKINQTFTFKDMLEKIPMNVESSNPILRERSDLDLNSKKDFIHYNSSFVKWLDRSVEDGILNDRRIHMKALEVYEKVLRGTARVYYVAYLDIIKNQGVNLADSIPETKKELKKYQDYTEGRISSFDIQEEYRSYYDLIIKRLEGKISNQDEYNAFVAPGFWLRRTLDGSAKLWFKLLEKVMNRYDKEFIKFYSTHSN